MVNSLLIMAWPYKNLVLTSLRSVSDYFMPDVYQGNATVTQISSRVNATGYEIIYRCRGCIVAAKDGSVDQVQTSAGAIILGRAQAFDAPDSPECPDEIVFTFHTNGYGQWMAPLDTVGSHSYEKWAALATRAVPGICVS
jgi:cellobiose dehydrogenase (acceptor)